MVRQVPLLARVMAALLTVVIVLYMLVPLLVVVGASVSTSRFLTFPPAGFSLEWFGKALQSDIYLQPLQTSLALAFTTTLLATSFGTAAALALSRFEVPFSKSIQATLLSPLIVPTIILAIGTLTVVSVLGEGPNFAVILITHTILAIPYVMRTVLGVMARSDGNLEEAARMLGAGVWSRYRHVVIPVARPGILGGAFFAFNISFDDAVVALFLRTPHLETLPIAIYGRLEYSADPSVAAISTVTMLITAITVFALEKSIGLGKAFS